MKEVIKIFNQIQDTNSKNEKQSIIAANANNELFKKCLIFLLDNMVITGISSKKIKKTISVVNKKYMCEAGFEDIMSYLSENNSGRDEDISVIQYFIKEQPKEYQEFYKQMITKTYRLGCNDKTVNKAIPGLIKTWDIQLGSSYDKLKLKDGEKFFLSQKLNGNRCTYYKGQLMSRQGKVFTGMQHIISDLEQLGTIWVYDGELIRKNIDSLSDGENFRIGTGIINSDAERKEEIKLVIFDVLFTYEFDNGTSDVTYTTRKAGLEMIKQEIIDKGLKNIEVVEMVYEGTDQTQIMKWLDYAVEQGWEGLMLNKDAPYKCKRTTDLIKIKQFYTMDLPIVEVLEGDGRLKGTLGALVVQYKDNTVNVGSGFDDATRAKFWSDRDNLIGKICEVKYKETTCDKKTGLESLQFPIFEVIRADKDEPSYN